MPLSQFTKQGPVCTSQNDEITQPVHQQAPDVLSRSIDAVQRRQGFSNQI